MAKNVNKIHRDGLSFNERVGTWITAKVGSMWTAYMFGLLACISLPSVIKSHDPLIIVAWLAQTFLQLVLLPIIIVGQNVQSRHSELIAENDYEVNVRAEQENLEIIEKLDQLLNDKSN